MCERLTRQQLTRRLTFCAVMACAFAAGLLCGCSTPSPIFTAHGTGDGCAVRVGLSWGQPWDVSISEEAAQTATESSTESSGGCSSGACSI